MEREREGSQERKVSNRYRALCSSDWAAAVGCVAQSLHCFCRCVQRELGFLEMSSVRSSGARAAVLIGHTGDSKPQPAVTLGSLTLPVIAFGA